MKRRTRRRSNSRQRRLLQGHCGIVITGASGSVYGVESDWQPSFVREAVCRHIPPWILCSARVFMLVVSLLVGIVSAGLGYMLLNISRGRSISIAGRSGVLLQKPAGPSDRSRICTGADPGGHSPSLFYYVSYTIHLPQIASLAAAGTVTAGNDGRSSQYPGDHYWVLLAI